MEKINERRKRRLKIRIVKNALPSLVYDGREGKEKGREKEGKKREGRGKGRGKRRERKRRIWSAHPLVSCESAVNLSTKTVSIQVLQCDILSRWDYASFSFPKFFSSSLHSVVIPPPIPSSLSLPLPSLPLPSSLHPFTPSPLSLQSSHSPFIKSPRFFLYPMKILNLSSYPLVMAN